VDYFLFDLKKGYCDYYASAMVVLAAPRASGPARHWIRKRTYDLNSRRFQVTEADAHSWSSIFPEDRLGAFRANCLTSRIERAGKRQLVAPQRRPPWRRPAPPSGYVSPGGGISWQGCWLAQLCWFYLAHFRWMRLRQLGQPRQRRGLPAQRHYGILLAASIEAGIRPMSLPPRWGARQELAEPGLDPGFGERTIEAIRAITHAIVHLSYNRWFQRAPRMCPFSRQCLGLRWRLSLVWALKYWQVWRAHLGINGL